MYYYQPYVQSEDTRQMPTFPGPFPPGFPSGGQTERRLNQLERNVAQLQRTVDRHSDQLNRLNRRLRRLEQQFGFATTSEEF